MRFLLRRFVLVLSTLASITSASRAAAQSTVTTVFDFEAPAADQTGDYAAEAGAELASGVGRLATASDWADRAQRVRVLVDVDNGGVETPRAVIAVPVASLPAAFRGRATLDGTDVIATLGDGTALERPVASGVSTPSGRGVYLVRVPALPVGSSTIALYAGDAMSAAVVDPLPFFTDPSPSVRYAVSGGFLATDVQVVSMVAANDVVLGGTTETLGALEGRIPTGASLGTEIVAAGPIAAAWSGAGGDSLAPESFAGTSFVSPAPRYDEAVFVAAPFGDATLTFSRPAIAAVTVPSGTVQRIDALVGDMSVIAFDADVPVVVVRGSDSGDVTPLPPAATELLGVGSGTVLVAAGPTAATVTSARSNGTTQTVSVPAHTTVALAGGASQGGGDAIRITADVPVGAMTYGDGDGGEAVTFLPPTLLGRELVLPIGAQFVVIATALPNTTCRLLAADGTEIASGTSSAFAPPTPGRIFFGNGATNGLHLAAPARLTCDGAVWALFEDASSETEKLMIPAEAHRPHPGGPVSLTPGGAETRFTPGVAAVTTPGLAAMRPMTAIRSIDATSTHGFGGDVRFQVAVDGGAWSIPSGGALVAATGDEGAAPEDFASIPLDGARTIAVRALLETDGVADATVDEVTLEAELVPPPVRLVFTPIDTPQRVGVELTTELSAVDASGAVVATSGDVTVSGQPTGVVPEQTVSLVDGRVTVAATPAVGAASATLVATGIGLDGTSNAFGVIAASDTASLAVVSGDGQMDAPGATLAEPIVVRVTDASGAPIGGATVTFEAVDGSAAPASATTGTDGTASATWTLGDTAGSQTLRASLADDASVAVVVSATAVEPAGGCDCRAAPGAPQSGLLGWMLVALGLVLRRGRRLRPPKEKQGRGEESGRGGGRLE